MDCIVNINPVVIVKVTENAWGENCPKQDGNRNIDTSCTLRRDASSGLPLSELSCFESAKDREHRSEASPESVESHEPEESVVCQ